MLGLGPTEIMILLLTLVIPGGCALYGFLTRPGRSPVHAPGSAVRRLGAVWIDVVVVYLPAVGVAAAAAYFYVEWALSREPLDLNQQLALLGRTRVLVSLAAFVPFWLYSAGMESSGLRATLGKLAMGLKVSDGIGGRLSFGRAAWRGLVKYFNLALGGFCSPISDLAWLLTLLRVPFTERKQALHDLLVGSAVTTADAGAPGELPAGPHHQGPSTSGPEDGIALPPAPAQG